MKTQVLKTANGNYIALINGNEIFINKEGIATPAAQPLWQWLKNICQVFDVNSCEPLEIIEEYERALDKNFNEIKERYATEKAKILKEQEELREEEEREERDLLEMPVIDATPENLRIVLRYLNRHPWGTWKLPQMSIGYSAHQYDCEGKQITTITLDKAIPVDTWEGVKKLKYFKSGSKRGHLENYYLI